METLYGDFGSEQLIAYREKLHKKLFWLLLYKDPQTKDEYAYVDFEKYFVALMQELDGLNDVLLEPPELVELMSLLQAAYNESTRQNFNYRVYRKFVLDAHTVLDKLDFGEVAQ